MQRHYQHLGDIITDEMIEKKLTITYLAENLYDLLGYKNAETTKLYISFIKDGYIYGSPTDQATNKDHNVTKLAILLYAIGFAGDSQVIKEIKEIDKNRAKELKKKKCFVYPPEEGISYKEMIRKKPLPAKKEPTLLQKIGTLPKQDRQQIESLVNELYAKALIEQ